MDVVTDLSSQCVSFITIYQEICKKYQDASDESSTDFAVFADLSANIKIDHSWFNDGLRARVEEIVWSSKDEVIHNDRLEHFFKHCRAIVSWLDNYKKKHRAIHLGGLYSTAYEWRGCVREILYQDKTQRIELACILEYMPIQVIWCLGGIGFNFRQQRLLQIWSTNCEMNVLSDEDKEFNKNWWESDGGNHEQPGTDDGEIFAAAKPRELLAKEILSDDKKILKLLQREEAPLPFDTIFGDELNEIAESQRWRRKIKGAKKTWENAKTAGQDADPQQRAAAMDLYGLTFSGGGIRSATFGLGILQKLAEIGLLSRFDYISTVSGGGYIGSWFETWIQRSGSMSKVMDRLCPDKSADPMSDELRPIRWLRMFSNYLAPDAGFMSADSWTMGITLVRNMLLNQVILFCFICCGLSAIKEVFFGWVSFTTLFDHNVVLSLWKVTGFSSLILIPGAFMAGWGMHAYNPEHPPKSLNLEKSNWLYICLLIWAGLSTFLLSGWMTAMNCWSFPFKLWQLWPASVVGFIGMLLIAYVGAYQKCVPTPKKWYVIYTGIFISSVIAAALGYLLLCGSWELINLIVCSPLAKDDHSRRELAFILGVPLILEAISITVVIRMAIMGDLFPDIRREWWGRVGALIHRFIFLWLIVSFFVLFFPSWLERLHITSQNPSAIIGLFGGWSAVVGFAVKLAFGPKVSGNKASDGSTSAVEIFVMVAPYLFAIGLLFICSLSLRSFERILEHCRILTDAGLIYGVFVGLFGVLALGLSWRIGVNEFSLHHFYRNRLSRAYLGATRRREDRDRTANNFTDFDEKDDVLLTRFTTANNYTGPYPILNCTLNSSVVTKGSLDKQDRKGESFVFTSKYCGYDFCRNRPSANSPDNPYEYGYRPTDSYGYAGGAHLSTAMSISGAAADPDMGYHTSPSISFLLTVFNVRLGRWMGNPRKSKWKRADPQIGLFYLLKDLVGSSDINSEYVCLTDGGHFDNMGIYELVRRRCKHILVCDGEQDTDSSCEGFATAIRRCRIDFGVEIEIDIEDITKKNAETSFAKQHFAKGKITYPGDKEPSGILIYVKTSLTGNETVDVRQYHLANKTFPQQSTADQFFDESQFESYRKLGYMSLSHNKENGKGLNKDDFIIDELMGK